MTPPSVLRLLQRFDRSALAAEAPPASEGPVRPQPLDAMRAELAAHGAATPMPEHALVLVRSGVVDAQTTAALEPWRRTPFIWRERALTGAKISDFLLLHGFRPMTPSASAVVDAAVADPVSAIEDPAPLWSAIFGRQLVECALDAGASQPRADRLMADLAGAGRPKIELEELRQVLEPGRWRVSFRCLGQRHAFGAAHRGSRLDVDAVVSAFNALLAHVAHPCRAFRIDRPAPAAGGPDARAWIVVTRGERFEHAARALGIPLVVPAKAPRTVPPSRQA